MPAVYVPKLYRDYFTESLDDPELLVMRDDPASRPPKLLVVQGIPGGGSTTKNRVLMWRRIIAQWWVGDEDAGGEFGEQLRDLVVDSPKALATVHQVAIVGEPGQFDDPDDTAPRFQMTFDALVKRVTSRRTTE